MSKMGCFGVVSVTRGHWKKHQSIEHTYEFLLAFHSNYVSILHRLWDIVRSWSKIAVLTYPISIWRSNRGWPRWNFAEVFGIRKLEGLPFHVV